MGPRRMDGFARPATGHAPQPARPEQPVDTRIAPQPQAQPHPVQRPVQRPVPQGYDRGEYPQQQRTARPEAVVPREAAAERAPRVARKGKAWRVVLQFLIGLVVIVGVAAAIVMLYIRYYQ